MKTVASAAIDLGATSGRVIVGLWANGKVSLDEVHRFPNAFRTLGERAYWDVGTLWHEIQTGLRAAKRKYPKLASVGVDTWAVDHVLVDGSGRLVYPAHAYRDTRTQPLVDSLTENQCQDLYRWTGLPLYPYNTSLQLQETLQAIPSLRLARAKVLAMADYFNFLLSGVQANELSLWSHSQLLDVKSKRWSPEALRHFGVNKALLHTPLTSPRKLGSVRGLEGVAGVETILVPGHDTACAFAAMPAAEEGTDLFLSSGTWSLLGFESETPVLGEEARAAGVSNERSGDGRYRPLRSNLGLWLWEKAVESDPKKPKDATEWKTLIQAAKEVAVPSVAIDCADRALFNPADMKAAVAKQLKSKGGKVPRNLPEWLRLITHSLGLAHAQGASLLAGLGQREFKRILMVGGGSKNPLLAQATADAAGLPVRAMNLEGSAVGNLANQWIALGVIPDLAAFRRVFDPQCKGTLYTPKKK